MQTGTQVNSVVGPSEKMKATLADAGCEFYTSERARKQGQDVGIAFEGLVDGVTIVHVLAVLGDHERINALADAGTALNVEDKNGRTPLHYAASEGNHKTIRAIVDAGVSPEDLNETGSVLADAAFVGPETVRLLVELGFTSDGGDALGNTALHSVSEVSNPEVIRLVLNAGGDKHVNTRDMHGRTPLHCAVMEENVEGVKLLLEAGSDASIVDKDGNTPRDIAATKNCDFSGLRE